MYHNKSNDFFHGIMFHHFHDDYIHKMGQGSISADQFEEIIKYCALKSNKPNYIRIGKSGEKILTHNSLEKWKFGKIRKISNGKNTSILVHGKIAELAFDVQKISPQLFDMTNLKGHLKHYTKTLKKNMIFNKRLNLSYVKMRKMEICFLVEQLFINQTHKQ